MVVSTDLPTPGRALAIGAHPDDIELHCGATLAKWAASGCRIFHLVCTDGSKGTWDPDTDPRRLVVARRGEQRAAHALLGGRSSGEDVVFLGWPDGELESGLRQRAQICNVIRRTRPDVVLGHDPWKRYRLHPDHRNAGFLVTDGIVAARDPLFFPEQAAPPHRPETLLLFESDAPDHAEDVEGFEHIKLAAALAHASQLRSTMDITGDPNAAGSGREAFAERLRARHARDGSGFGLRAAELFTRVDDL